ncbi:MAG: DNA-binding response regulator [Desulfobacteraceae bacterium]|nr:MAG: DNA-binding response regulator [Desulfobacteraceae bacterium]
MTKEKIGVVIAEDHQLFREVIVALLGESGHFAVLCQAGNGLEAIRCVRNHAPDLLLLDLSMPKMHGLSVIREVKNQFPNLIILALTIHEDEHHIAQAFKEGVDGYCLKDAELGELHMAIKSVLSGKKYISPSIAPTIMQGYLADREKKKTDTCWDTLTRREREIVKLVGEGYQNKAIADLLCISIKTVEKHRSNIMEKLDIHNAAALTSYAVRQGLVTLKS